MFLVKEPVIKKERTPTSEVSKSPKEKKQQTEASSSKNEYNKMTSGGMKLFKIKFFINFMILLFFKSIRK